MAVTNGSITTSRLRSLQVLDATYLPHCRQLTFLTMSVVLEERHAQQAHHAQQAQQAQHAQQQAGLAAGRAPRPPSQRVVFLYRLVAGHAAPSFGVHCAELAGVPEVGWTEVDEGGVGRLGWRGGETWVQT